MDARPDIPPFQDLLWPTLTAIQAIGGSGANREIDAKVVELEGFSEEQQAILHGPGPVTELSYRLAWARSYLKSVGALENSARGVWAVADQGKDLSEADMADIPARVRAGGRTARRTRRRGRRGATLGDTSDGENTDWKNRLLETLQTMPPAGFERLCQRVLRESGFISVEVRGRRNRWRRGSADVSAELPSVLPVQEI